MPAVENRTSLNVDMDKLTNFLMKIGPEITSKGICIEEAINHLDDKGFSKREIEDIKEFFNKKRTPL